MPRSEADCIGVSRDMIRIVLRQLRDEGVITLQGKGRGAKWVRREEQRTPVRVVAKKQS